MLPSIRVGSDRFNKQQDAGAVSELAPQSAWSRRASLPVCLCYGCEVPGSRNQEFPVAVSCPCLVRLETLSDLLTPVSISANASRRSTPRIQRALAGVMCFQTEVFVPVNPAKKRRDRRRSREVKIMACHLLIAALCTN